MDQVTPTYFSKICVHEMSFNDGTPVYVENESDKLFEYAKIIDEYISKVATKISQSSNNGPYTRIRRSALTPEGIVINTEATRLILNESSGIKHSFEIELFSFHSPVGELEKRLKSIIIQAAENLKE